MSHHFLFSLMNRKNSAGSDSGLSSPACSNSVFCESGDISMPSVPDAEAAPLRLAIVRRRTCRGAFWLPVRFHGDVRALV